MRELGLPFDERMADLSTEGHMTTLQEFTDVVLVKPYKRDKLLLPAGAKGTVLTVHPEFMSYTVEFFEPLHCVETVPMNIIAPL